MDEEEEAREEEEEEEEERRIPVLCLSPECVTRVTREARDVTRVMMWPRDDVTDA